MSLSPKKRKKTHVSKGLKKSLAQRYRDTSTSALQTFFVIKQSDYRYLKQRGTDPQAVAVLKAHINAIKHELEKRNNTHKEVKFNPDTVKVGDIL